MDNTRDLPGYKYYVEPSSGERPAVFVAFLDLERDERARVKGILFEVEDFEALDARERNYARVDVTATVQPRPDGQVWAYFGSEEARARFDRGRAVVAEAYYEAVRADLERIGETLERPPVPVIPLERVDL